MAPPSCETVVMEKFAHPDFMRGIIASQRGVTPDGTCVNGASQYINMFGYLAYDGTSYDGSCSFFGAAEGRPPPLPEALGWTICLVLGLAFAALTSLMVFLSNRGVASEEQTGNNSEVFSTAGRTISAGLTAADVVSKWTWAATLLQSSNVAFAYGVSGPFWYASGATIQVILFAVLAIEIKRKCPAIHTMLEVVNARWGTAAHLTFLFFGLMTNLIVTAMLILGGAATINALTGMNTYAANFMIPVPVMLYTAFGGLKGTYYASFTHTFVIYLALLIFMWKIYAGPSDLGSSDRMYDNLLCAAERAPVDGNKYGQFLTMNSKGGLMFGIINIVGNFGTVFVDQSYWQGAIACKPSATWKGYLLGGMAWFAIPFSMATALGLAGRALDIPLTTTEAGQGLVPPAVAVHLLGQGGAFLVAFQLFLAVTSTANSEQLAVASLFSYDVYKRYLKTSGVTGKELIWVSRVAICAWAIFSGIIATILFEMGIGLGWVYQAMGNFIGCAVVPICFALLWKDCSAAGAVVGTWCGLVAAMIAWLSTAATENDGKVTVDTLGQLLPALAGNLASLLVSPVVCIALSLAQPQNFNWDDLRVKTDAYTVEHDKGTQLDKDGEEGTEALDKAYRYTLYGGSLMTFLLIIAWPLLALPADPFSRSYFGWWVAVAFIWGHVAFVITVLYPLYEFLAPVKEEEALPPVKMSEIPVDFPSDSDEEDPPPRPAPTPLPKLTPPPPPPPAPAPPAEDSDSDDMGTA